MSKRRLTRRQAWRINKVQEERAQRAQRRETRTPALLEDNTLGPEQTGLLIAHFGTQVEIEAEDGSRQRCHLRANLGDLVAGDQVVWRDGSLGAVIVAVLPRKSLLSRPDRYGRLKPVAANIDRIVVVVAVAPQPHATLIDRYLVAAESVGIEPAIVLNKADLIDAAHRPGFDDLLAPYRRIGYTVLEASTHTDQGLSDLRTALASWTSVFVGQSGVGKSSLVNALLPGTDTRTGPLSEQSGLGRHTTTTARLFHFPSGGQLIDSPGIREFGLWHMDREQLLLGFREFRPFLGHCKFRDCRHQQDPGCALRAAVASGDIHPRRLASFEQIAAELEV
ncbi:MAG TPA: small ribosomal subunit biogenesis GTPase RsgA [Spongiibacteraceae bacterium]|jgi:ribosome biogenesis GTPase|nr:small ribosomal subunit biogenesis GTPase RsgA [Spongiibacteraceae bacterium]HUH36680.1 small ribosomal subunit biogenesis GTPase RsgA [Spongiibacteraceae bacterium]